MVKTIISEQQMAFAEAFLVSNDQRAAAIAAEYSAKTATTAAYKLMKKPQILAYIAARRAGKTAEELRPQITTEATPRNVDPAFRNITGGNSIEFLTALMNSPDMPIRERAKIAMALLPYENQKGGAGGAGGGVNKPLGKKAARQEEAANPDNPFTKVATRPLRAVK